MESKIVTKRPAKFKVISDPYTQLKIIEYIKSPLPIEKANSFMFWLPNEKPENWGLTLKYTAADKNTHEWKVSFQYNGTQLVPCNSSSDLAEACSEDASKLILEIFNHYNKK